jgi:DNA replication protein DnaC
MSDYAKILAVEKTILARQCRECSKNQGELLRDCSKKCHERYTFYVHLAYANVNRELWDLELSDFDTRSKYDDEKEARAEVLDVVQLYVSHLDNAYEKGLGLILFGPHGTGKSMLAACIIKQALRNGRKAMIRDFADIVNVIRRGFRADEEAMDLEREFEETDFYCIENFGINQFLRAADRDATPTPFRGPDYITREIARLFNKRRHMMLPSIITTYQSLEELSKSQDDEGKQLLSTFYGKSEHVRVPGEDYRKSVLKHAWKKNLIAK